MCYFRGSGTGLSIVVTRPRESRTNLHGVGVIIMVGSRPLLDPYDNMDPLHTATFSQHIIRSSAATAVTKAQAKNSATKTNIS